MAEYQHLTVERAEHVDVVTLSNPPYNFMTLPLLRELLAALSDADRNPVCRAIVLAADGKTFCAGADFKSELGKDIDPASAVSDFYKIAMTIYDIETPMVAAVTGAAVGAGFGLALAADFRVASSETTFSANFNRLGIHPGFGMSVTLPRIIGTSNAELLFYTGRRIKGEEASRIGLVSELVARADVLAHAKSLAAEIAESAPIAVRDTRATMRRGLAERIREANRHEQAMQEQEMQTADFREGVDATAERRTPVFTGR